ncbi:MAG: helix-turn-helix domain-containing protein [Enterovibrio sp.]
MIQSKEQIAQRIREAREYKEITQLEMANHLSMARQTYLDIESAKTEPKISSLVLIANITNRPFTWLLYDQSTSSDVAFTYREELNHLLMLLNMLPESARELVIGQALHVAEYMNKNLENETQTDLIKAS